MDDLAAELERAKQLDVADLADAIVAIGFECTRCGACCRGHDDEHVATIFPDEVRDIVAGTSGPGRSDGTAGRPSVGGASEPETAYDWRDVARPMPFGLREDGDGTVSGETFEWALQIDECGDCTFYEEGDDGTESAPTGACGIYDDRPLICQTYPFSVDVGGSEPMGDVVARSGPVRAHECEGLGRDIDEEDAIALARTLKERAIREVEEMRAVRAAYEPAEPDSGRIVVHDSEGAKRPDGSSSE